MTLQGHTALLAKLHRKVQCSELGYTYPKEEGQTDESDQAYEFHWTYSQNLELPMHVC